MCCTSYSTAYLVTWWVVVHIWFEYFDIMQFIKGLLEPCSSLFCWSSVTVDIQYSTCLGPIARLMLGACPSHSEAAAHLRSPLIRHPHCAYPALVYQKHSNKDTSLTLHALNLYLYTEIQPCVVYSSKCFKRLHIRNKILPKCWPLQCIATTQH